MSGRIKALDGLRGVAILLVLLTHSIGLEPFPDVPSRIFELIAHGGWTGVTLFFVLSGYLITGNLLNGRSRPHYFGRFYARRALRIFPLYYAVVAVTLLIDPSQADGSPLWYWLYATNVFEQFGGDPGPILAVTWSLAVEEQFYLLWPFIVRRFDNAVLLRWCAGLIVIGPVFRIVAPAAGLPQAQVLLFGQVDALAIGAAVAIIQCEHGIERLLRAARIGTLLLPAVYVAASSSIDFGGSSLAHTLGLSLMAVCYAGAMVIAVNGAGAIACTPLALLGRWSYGIYLLHRPVLAGLAAMWISATSLSVALGVPWFAGQCLFTFLLVALSAGAAALSWRYFEVPLLRLREQITVRPLAARRDMTHWLRPARLRWR